MWLKLLLTVSTFAFAEFSVDSRDSLRSIGGENKDAVSPFTDPVDGINYRLPNDTIPLSYVIRLTTNIDRGYYEFQGRVTITIEALQNTPEITLHYRQLEISSVRLMRSGGGSLQSNVSFTTRPEVEFLIITPAQPLEAGRSYQVEIDYFGEHRIEKEGFYLASYIGSFGDTRMMAATNFKSTDARHAFPW